MFKKHLCSGLIFGLVAVTISQAASLKFCIYCDLENPPAVFAAGDIRTALTDQGYSVDAPADLRNLKEFAGDVRIVLATQSMTTDELLYQKQGGLPVGPLESQAYALRKTGMDDSDIFWVFGGDRAGVMYGGLRLAEIIQTDGLESFQPEQESPHIGRRGIKFNIPLDVRTISFADCNSSNSDMHREYVWDLEFWKAWLDDVARYRYNFLSLWNRHPFPNLVKLDDYPEVAMEDVYGENNRLIRKMTVDEKIAMWNAVIEHADNRCIDVIWITWNIILDHAKNFGLKESGHDPQTVDYMRQCTAALLRTYPKLHGIGITAGERMRELEDDRDKEEWLFNTYGLGVLDVLKEQPERQVLFMHRYWWTSFENIMAAFRPLIDHPNIQFDMSFKYSRARMYSAPNPPFAKNSVLKTLPPDLRSWWNLRNDDILTFRWGDPDYVRSYIMNLPPEHQTAGYHMGSDRYTWGRETIMNDPASPRQLQTQFNWYRFMLWGRMGFNPSTPNDLFVKIMESRYPGVNAKDLFDAWQAASKIFPMATRFHWHDWDFMWHVETCAGYDENSGLRNCKRFYNVLDFIENPVMEESGLINIADYANAVTAGQTIQLTTPLEHAELMKTCARQALSGLKNIRVEKGTELYYITEDIRAMAQAGLYYGHKIQAATYHAFFQRSLEEMHRQSAIQHMLRSCKAWEMYIDIFRKQYTHGILAIINREVDFDEMIRHVREDVARVGGQHTDLIKPLEAF